MSTIERSRSRSFSWSDPEAAAAAGRRMEGLHYLEAIVSGELPPPPFAEGLGLSLVEIERGRAVFAMEPAEWMYNALGSVHGGVLATLLDSCMGCAVHSTLEAGVGFTTSDLHVRYVRAISATTGPVLAEGKVVHRGRSTATAEGRLYVADGETLIAHASTGCVILRPEAQVR
ncbi:MAG TPA: PaaI family thioesterase [Solirubrobacteraceae bacterium]